MTNSDKKLLNFLGVIALLLLVAEPALASS